MEENNNNASPAEENSSASSEEASSTEAASSENTETTTEDNSYLLLLRVDEDLCEFQFEDEIAENPDLYTLNYNIVHLYNLVLLIALFLIGKWIVDKTFTCFNSIWKGWN